MLFFHVEIFSTLRSISFFCCNLTENCCSIHIAFTEMNVERITFAIGTFATSSGPHLVCRYKKSFWVALIQFPKFSLSCYFLLISVENWKNPNQNKPGLQELNIIILSCLLQFSKFSISYCFFFSQFLLKVMQNWKKPR